MIRSQVPDDKISGGEEVHFPGLVENAERGVRSAECGVRSAERGVRSAECFVYGCKPF